MDSKRPMKRSKRVVLTTLAAAGAAAVAGCDGSADWNDEPAVDAFPYATVAECRAANAVPDDACQEAYNDALGNHEQAAPRFATQPLCEDEFGQNQCQPRVAGNSNYWVPILGGFMVGQALANADIDIDGRKRYRYGGLYRSRRSGGWYAGGPTGGPLQRSGSTWRAGSSAFDRPTSSPPVRSSSGQSASRGGFGGRSRSSWGG
ncbi:MAG TPA: DUF1190 domain-containing protein [Allosphingosinicella sp.]|jgi:uncharacterized protein YgiB involved in biofilm formation